jgi:glycosyltransferase involved in cell wall biosynthesis
MVVATRNRGYTLERVLPSFFSQRHVDEIVLVSDASTDNTEEVFLAVAADYPNVRAVHLRNEHRLGQPGSRNRGAAAASNDYILFCDDDEYLEEGYAATCLDILRSRSAGLVSGRRIYLEPNENPTQALARFGCGRLRLRPYNRHLCFLVNDARFSGEVSQPIASPVMLTRTETVRLLPFDEHYGLANGYREESDFQVRVFLSGRDVIMSGRVHSFHLPMSEVRTGGQRTSSLTRIKGMVEYTGYFYDKHYDDYARRVGIRTPRWAAKGLFAVFAVYKVALLPRGQNLVSTLTRAMRPGTEP